ncbi:carbohydrate kinase family protein [Polyangium jinanense]|uniref:Carbohydrate kinase family protein n=1 Tax=Polyangium jinanense TaxID=2829994 RepID=A0A9X3XB90_9BACT|nr:carbohydrate kinase family protein [Polyangium jinanense]MDC3961054.1 carbohydrate kinase family protein [Polyangium jinanense]MDC3987474.1 carbohydrate kinase family protein [Polyangium jinanense]
MVFLVVGDANADLSSTLVRFPDEGDDVPMTSLGYSSGGSGANVATALAKLGARARLVTAVGSDPGAEIALRAAKEAGVDLSFVETHEAVATGHCVVAISPGGERTFLSFRGANAVVSCPDFAAVFQDVVHLHVAGHALLEGEQWTTTLALMEEALRREIPISLDICLPLVRARAAELFALAPQFSVLFGNQSELGALGGFAPENPIATSCEAAIAELLAAGVPLVVGKLGAQGAVVAEGPARTFLPSFPADVRDTTGAGDGFVAAFLYAWRRGASVANAGRLGNAAGALVVSRLGAATSLPGREELSLLLSGHGIELESFLFANKNPTIGRET